jgi:citrate lyase subunit beta / citryl-CoA lyase
MKMKPTRSLLFVPGNKPAWTEKAIKYGADVLILDLEDSVPDNDKVASRPLVKEALKYLTEKGQTCDVRVNGFATGLPFDDLDGIICLEFNSVAFPKIGNGGRYEGPGHLVDPFGETASHRNSNQ